MNFDVEDWETRIYTEWPLKWSVIVNKSMFRTVSSISLRMEARLASLKNVSTHHRLAHQSPSPAAASTPSTGLHLLTTLLAACRLTTPILTAKLPESLTIGNVLPTGTSTPRKSHSGPHPCSTLYSKRRSGGTRDRASSCPRR